MGAARFPRERVYAFEYQIAALGQLLRLDEQIVGGLAIMEQIALQTRRTRIRRGMTLSDKQSAYLLAGGLREEVLASSAWGQSPYVALAAPDAALIDQALALIMPLLQEVPPWTVPRLWRTAARWSGLHYYEHIVLLRRRQPSRPRTWRLKTSVARTHETNTSGVWPPNIATSMRTW